MIPVVILFLDNLGGGELLVILFFVLIFFGSEKIPGLAKGLGKAMREFRNAMNDVKADIEQSASVTSTTPEKLSDSKDANSKEENKNNK